MFWSWAITLHQSHTNRIKHPISSCPPAVALPKLRESLCCSFSWCFVGYSPHGRRKLADQKTWKSIDWVDFRLLHYAGEVTYCAVGEWQRPGWSSWAPKLLWVVMTWWEEGLQNTCPLQALTWKSWMWLQWEFWGSECSNFLFIFLLIKCFFQDFWRRIMICCTETWRR